MRPCMWTSIYYELPPEEAFRRIAEAGWQAIELSTEHLEVLRDAPDSQARLVSLRHLASSLDLAMPQAHLTITANVAHIDPERRQHDQETIRRDLQVLAALGIPTGVLHTGGNRDLQTAEQVHEQQEIRLQAVSDLADCAKSLGLRIALENGTGRSKGPEDCTGWGGSTADVRELIGQIGSPALGICLDTGHAILEGWDNVEAVRTAGDLLIALHIADNDGSGDQHRIPFAYGSKADWPAIIAALRQADYHGPFNLEIPGERGRPLVIIDAAIRYALEVCRVLLEDGVATA